MNRRHLLLALAALPVVGFAQSLKDMAGALKDPLIALLMNQLGLTNNQATGGMGSLLTLAKGKMSTGDFGKVTSLLPQATKYMDTAKQLGAVVGPLTNSKGLNESFSKLGMNKATAAKFVPTVTDYVGKIGGEPTKNMLAAVLK
jgi:hypothetical protein